MLALEMSKRKARMKEKNGSTTHLCHVTDSELKPGSGSLIASQKTGGTYLE